ncbi:SOSS complex subunit B homolog isoform X2 [Phoenix dactylifera]|uniref:SOSS complex subunit B homolog isoform X2 n=1 Tax=Phoenix dactylifera TaxID=42345 RepID=A0A8B7BIL0_PHODC|nr:SOSS complex subunit B homolog isoform X2 [Phoenix dactylifera]
MASAVDAVGNPIPTLAVLMASSKHIGAPCRGNHLNFAFVSSGTSVGSILGSSIMENMVPLKDVAPAATNTVNTQFILLEKGSITQDGKETTCLALVADETASVHFQMWGSECKAFEPGDIIRLTDGIFSYHKNNLVLRGGKKGKAEKVGEFTMLFVETPNMSEIHWARDPDNPKKFLQEAVISPHSRIFPPSQ